jgi:hypothetical protein
MDLVPVGVSLHYWSISLGFPLARGCAIRLFFLPLSFFFVRGHRSELQGVDAALLGHFVSKEGVDHAVAGGLHLGGKGIGSDDDANVKELGQYCSFKMFWMNLWIPET